MIWACAVKCANSMRSHAPQREWAGDFFGDRRRLDPAAVHPLANVFEDIWTVSGRDKMHTSVFVINRLQRDPHRCHRAVKMRVERNVLVPRRARRTSSRLGNHVVEVQTETFLTEQFLRDTVHHGVQLGFAQLRRKLGHVLNFVDPGTLNPQPQFASPALQKCFELLKNTFENFPNLRHSGGRNQRSVK